MKKGKLILISLALFVLLTAAGVAALRFAPRGALNPDSPAAAVETLLKTRSAESFREELRALWPQELTEFEDRDIIFDALYDTLSAGELTFRELSGVSIKKEPVYLLSAADSELCALRLRRENGAWTIAGTEIPEGVLRAGTRTLRISAPAGAAVTVNGLPVSEGYIADSSLPYAEMTELELRFAEHECAVLYEIPGFCGDAAVECADALLTFADGSEWRFVPTDAGTYSFRLEVPQDAVVTVGGTELTAADSSGTVPLRTKLTAAEDITAELPQLTVYEAAGLFSAPEIIVRASDGTELQPEEINGVLCCYPLGSSALEGECTQLVTDYLTAMCRYGAHHFGFGTVTAFVVPDTGLAEYFAAAQSSLQWISGETVDFQSITASDFIPVGESRCFCRANVLCTTKTAYETRELDMDYQLLLRRGEKGWLVEDMSFD